MRLNCLIIEAQIWIIQLLEFPQNVISKRIYCSEVPICRFFESLRMAVRKIEALE